MLSAADIGRFGEQTAARFLRGKRYVLNAVNYRCRFGEIDVIVSDQTYLIFVEVKTRACGALTGGAEAVDANKRRRLWRAAEMYLAARPTDLQPRFDVVEVEYFPGTPPTVADIRQIENAFGAEDIAGCGRQ